MRLFREEKSICTVGLHLGRNSEHWAGTESELRSEAFLQEHNKKFLFGGTGGSKCNSTLLPSPYATRPAHLISLDLIAITISREEYGL